MVKPVLRRRLLWAAVVLAAPLLGASGGGGGGDAHDGGGLSQECKDGLTNATCSAVNHDSGFHKTESNGLILRLQYDDDKKGCKPAAPGSTDVKTCVVTHECSTCKPYNCLLCNEGDKSKYYSEPLGTRFLFLVVSLTVGAFISTILEALPRQTFRPPFTVVMFVLGMLMGWLAEDNLLGCALSDSVNAWKHQDPHSILYALLPPLLFESAFNVNYHVFTKVVRSSFLLATTGVGMSTFLTGCVAMWLFGAQFDRIQYENPLCEQFATGDQSKWSGPLPAPLPSDGLGIRDESGACSTDGPHMDGPRGCFDCSADGWWASFMFGAIVSATDPVAVVAVLNTLGAQPKLSHMIEGESLLNDGTAVVIFLVFKGLLLHNIQEDGHSNTVMQMIAMVARLAVGGVVLGLVFSYLIYAWLRISRNMTANIEISIMVLSVYLVFYLSEHVFGASGVLATVVYGLSLAKRKHLAMTVSTSEQNEVVWQEIGYVANSFTFALAGVILLRIVMDTEDRDVFKRVEQFFLAVALYFILTLIRLLAIFMNYHAMRACTKGGYKVKVREAIFMTYSGLRGAVSLCVALFVDHMDGMPQLVKDVIIFHTCLCVFFTVFVNGITAGNLYKMLRLGVQGGVRGEVDAGSVIILVEKMQEYVEGMREHWFHGAHNLREGNYKLVQDMLDLKLKQDKKGRDLAPISDLGELTIPHVDVNKLWAKEMSESRKLWRKDPLRSTTHHSHKSQAGDGADLGELHKHDGLSDELVAKKRRVCYNPDPHGGAESSFDSGHHAHTKNSHHGTVKFGLQTAAQRSRFHLSLETDQDTIQRDLYSIYLTAIKAHYEEMREENELTATTCDYLCRAIASGSDFLKSVHTDSQTAEHGSSTLAVIHRAHDSLKEHIHCFGLSDAWSAPPIHKLQIMTEAYFAEYEAHEQVLTYLHSHLEGGFKGTHGVAIHKAIRKECEEVCADCLTQLARRAYQQHTLMPLAHTFMIFRAGYLYMKEEIKMLKIHGLMSVSCHDEIVALLDKRYQDIRAEFSNDGVHGQWIRMREWCFRHCGSKKYADSEGDHVAVAKEHEKKLDEVVKSRSTRNLNAQNVEPEPEPKTGDLDLVPPGGDTARP